VGWLLIGDDGQHDPEIYAQAVDRHPDRVHAVVIRQLTGGQRVLAGSMPVADQPETGVDVPRVPTVAGQDGAELTRRLASVPGVLRR
jgi:phosphatidate phosphatase APP1